MDFKKPGFRHLVRKRPNYLIKILEKYDNIIYSDIDTVWLKDPRPFLKGDYDFWAILDGFIDGRPYISK